MDWSDTFRQVSGRAWIDSIPLALKEDLQRLAEMINKEGREPNWGLVIKQIKEEWPEDVPRSSGTVRETVRRLAESV